MKLNRFFLLTVSLLVVVFLTPACRSMAPHTTRSQQNQPEYVTPAGSKTSSGEGKGYGEPAVDSIDKSADVSGKSVWVSQSYDIHNRERSRDEIQNDLTDQELIDLALEYYQASDGFWQQGDLENAIDCLDRAYSLILRVDGVDNPLIIQEKEDLRITISRRIVEVYSSRHIVANGHFAQIQLDMNEHVERAIKLFQGRERNFFLETYARSGRYRPAIVRELRKAGLPEELSWLPFIESGYKVRALSTARALGMWQFIASTGYKFGLTRDTWVDERMDTSKSTTAAIAYLTELHQMFGEWTTALAGYNCGENRVLRVIREQRINYMDNFWDLYMRLPRETAFYVPKFLAVIHIVNDPEAYGFTLPPLDDELEYDYVTVNKPIHVRDVARELNVDYDIMRDLNAELRQNVTPPNLEYSLKVPVGKRDMLLARIDNIPAYSPPVPEYVTHTVRSGETLSVIAQRYRTSISAIMSANNLTSKNYLRTGWSLRIPTGSQAAPVAAAAGGTGTRTVEYTVQTGDSLWKIARQFNTTVNSIQASNNLGASTTLTVGQRLRISTGTTGAKPGGLQDYTVRSGDSPYLIAKRHSMNLYDFLKLNNLNPNSKIYPGQLVQVIAQ